MGDIFIISWFIVFIVVILIAFVANIIIIWAILRDKTMHTSTYFYIINVNITDIILVLSCLPERLAAVFRPNDGFHLGMFTCYLLPFLQQISMHAALGFLLILTVHRCYPAGVPHCLQGDLIRRQIRNHSQTLCLIWTFAIVINLPLFSITKYEKHVTNNHTNISDIISQPTCETEATEVWSRTYLIMLLVLPYIITGVFLIVIYGQVIRIILSSKKYAKKSNINKVNNGEHYHFLSHQDKFREIPARTSTSSSSTNTSNRRQQRNSIATLPISIMIPIQRRKCPNNSRSTQHLQIIIMLFIVILLYILLLLPYRLLNLLFIAYNQLFQDNLMNEMFFQWLLNTVRLLVFLNCALQPIIYLIISSRLRQTVLKLLQACWYKCYCQCHCALAFQTEQHYKTDTRAIQAYLSQKHQNINPSQNQQKKVILRDKNPSTNNIQMTGYQPLPLSRPPVILSHLQNKTPYTVTFKNSLRK